MREIRKIKIKNGDISIFSGYRAWYSYCLIDFEKVEKFDLKYSFEDEGRYELRLIKKDKKVIEGIYYKNKKIRDGYYNRILSELKILKQQEKNDRH